MHKKYIFFTINIILKMYIVQVSIIELLHKYWYAICIILYYKDFKRLKKNTR